MLNRTASLLAATCLLFSFAVPVVHASDATTSVIDTAKSAAGAVSDAVSGAAEKVSEVASSAIDAVVAAPSGLRKAMALNPTKSQPFAPSNARVKGDRKVKVTDWTTPEVCGGCHPRQYKGWKGSMHSNSFKDPIFQAEWALAEKQLGDSTTISNMCAGCHSPPGMLSQTIKFDPNMEGTEHGGFTAPGVANHGVSCDVCHTISGNNLLETAQLEHGNGSYVADPGPVKRGPLKDAVSPFHQTEYSEHHTKADFCGNCHNIFNPVTGFPLERTYDEWKYSVYARNEIQCQDCHMVPVETAIQVANQLKPAKLIKEANLGGFAGLGAQKQRDLVHDHAFVGGNAVITEAMGDKDSVAHAVIARKRLTNVAELEMGMVRKQGELHQLKVKVTNERAGHNLPTSLTFIREVWLDVTVTDDKGYVLLRSGALDSHGEIEAGATIFQNKAVDDKGDKAEYLWTVTRFSSVNTIPPKGHRYGTYYFNIPKGVKDVKVTAKLNYRSFSQHFVDHLLGKDKIKVPTVEMELLEKSYSVKAMANAGKVATAH